MYKTQLLHTFTGDPKQLNPLALAFVGDGIFELLVREELLKNGSLKPKTLHQKAVEHVSAPAQAAVYNRIVGILNTEESDIVRRAKNAKVTRVPKNSSPDEYHKATALEALFGYLYLSGNYSRILELFSIAWKHSQDPDQEA